MKKRKSSNRDVVLRFASDMFLKRGYQSTSIDDIVAVSKVSKTNIYYHFASKEAILLEILNDAIAYYQERALLIVSQQHVAVTARIEFLMRLMAHDPYHPDCQAGCPFLTLFAQTSREVPAVREQIQELFQESQQILEQLLHEGVTKGELSATLPVSQTATLILSVCEGGMFLSEVHQDSKLLDRIFQSLEWLLQPHTRM